MRLFRIRALIIPLVTIMAAAACEPDGDDASGASGGTGGSDNQTDTDGDGISDKDEGDGDTDGDGVPDARDADSDNDGIPDADEAGDTDIATTPVDSDGDGTPNFQDDDSDNNGILDATEGTGDADGDNKPDYADTDDDNDTIPDAVEIIGEGSDCDGNDQPDPPGTPEAPRDCDGDGADYRDTDSDNDSISDLHEGVLDTDGDANADRYDLDSDHDGFLDSAEAGDADVATAPVDTDQDTIPDFRDLDSDNDGLTDQTEGTLGTSPTNIDTDDDGVSDLVEDAAGTNPTDPADNPLANGDFVFVVPYQDPTTPTQDSLRFRTNIQFADLYFAFDRTGSMSAELNAFRNTMTGVSKIISDLRCVPTGQTCTLDADCATGNICFAGACVADPNVGLGCIPDLWTGIGRFDDLNTYFNLVSLQPDPAVTAAAVPTTGGGGAEAPYQPAHCIANPALCPNIANMGCTSNATSVGCPAFRDEAIRIYIQITDADQQCSGGGCASFTGASAGAALQSEDIKFISLYGTDDAGGTGTPLSVATEIAVASGTVNAMNQPFVYLATDAAVVDKTVQAVRDIARGSPLDVRINQADDPADAVDATQFIDYLEVNISGQGNCTMVTPTLDTDADTRDDAFPSLLPGIPICWDLHPIPVNTTVPATNQVQLYKAVLTVTGDGSPLDSRDVYFLIPPTGAVVVPR